MTARFSAIVSRHGYLVAIVAIALSTVLFLPGRASFAKGQWALLYLLVILLVASVAGTGPGLLAASATLFVLDGDDLESYCQTPAGGCPDPAVTERARRAVREGEAAGAQDAALAASPAAVTAAGDGGLYVPVHSPSGVSGVLTVQARANGRPYSAGDARR